MPHLASCLQTESMTLSYHFVIFSWLVNIYNFIQYAKLFAIKTIFTHSSPLNPKCIFHYILHNLTYKILMWCHILMWCLRDNNCILMKKWPRLAIECSSVGWVVNIYPLFQFSSEADNNWRAQLIQKIMQGNCAVISWFLILYLKQLAFSFH